jgi:uncharacterized protein (DUF2147 family)
MSLWKVGCTFVVSLFYLSTSIAASHSPVGTWVTIDDTTGKKRGIVTISESGGSLSAVINKIFPQSGDSGVCEKCPGAFKGKKVQGLQFMWGLKKEKDNEWSGGSILDPKSGRVYRAKITLQGNKLLVRGYMGISLLGRTQIWQKQ